MRVGVRTKPPTGRVPLMMWPMQGPGSSDRQRARVRVIHRLNPGDNK